MDVTHLMDTHLMNTYLMDTHLMDGKSKYFKLNKRIERIKLLKKKLWR
jgi:hypothetical protein